VILQHLKKRPHILVTAGPTREKIDPIRFISNYSTGTFGYAIAKEAARSGFIVTLISGPTALKAPSGIKFIRVESALDMKRAVLKEFAKADCLIMVAAVSDWRAGSTARRKVKRGTVKRLELVENPDILAGLGKKKGRRVLVGFALETEDLIKNAMEKIKKKNLDLIIANKYSPKADIFGNEKVNISIISRFGDRLDIRRKTKREAAKIILDKVYKRK